MSSIHAAVERACTSNDIRELKQFVFDKRNLVAVDKLKRSAMLIAAAYGNIPVIKLLDDKAEEILGYNAYKIYSARDLDGYNAISLAAKNGHIRAVVVLYQLGAYDIFTDDEQDWVTFAGMQVRSQDDQYGIAQTLKSDAQKRLHDLYCKQLYDEVTSTHVNPAQIRSAIKLVGDVNEPVYDEHTALYHAVRYRNVIPARILLEEGARVDPEVVPLALDSKNNELISLIGQYVPLNAKPITWGTLLDVLFDHAIRTNDIKVAMRLIPNMTMAKLEEALLYSAELGSDDIVKCLLDLGVNVDCRENSYRYRTPAMLAAKNGHLSTLQILIKHNANLRLRSERGIIKGLNALEYAKVYRRKNCINLLAQTLTLQRAGGAKPRIVPLTSLFRKSG